mmetsp:Transcript_2390/g.2339  ORF Transcript_2390/g.2339 Transcript_2390/m.2339 type:complete len:95 (-) Transcript_2390:373-657(-)
MRSIRGLAPMLLLDHGLDHSHLRVYIIHSNVGALLLRVHSDGLLVGSFLFGDELLLFQLLGAVEAHLPNLIIRFTPIPLLRIIGTPIRLQLFHY